VTFRGIPRPLLAFLGIAGAFSLADFSYAFLLLRAETVVGATGAIGLYVVYNVVYASHAFPAGILSDRVGRKPVVLLGYIAFATMSTLLILWTSALALGLAFVLYGLSYGMAEGTQRALVADFAPTQIKATVLGAYHSTVGVVKLASGLVAGFLWVTFRPEATFAFGAVTAAVAAGALILWKPSLSPELAA
jgi:MFS family permease